ncbi:MAG: hypothetical protein V3U93_05090 [Alphaproteobacteria bacterium]
MAKTFWNEELETMPPDELRQRESVLLAGQVDYLYRTSPYYRQVFDEAGIDPGAITSIEALEQVPFTEKRVLAQTQRDGALIGPHQCAPFEDIVRLVGTGGTSGKPIRIGWTRADIEAYSEMGARALWAMGCRPSDLVVNCFNYRLYAGGVMDHMSFEVMGAAILPYGVGKSRELLELLADIPGDKCLYATTSYAVRLAEVAGEAGIDPRSIAISKGFFSGEAGLQIPGYRDRIEGLWGMTARDLYGVAELGCQAGECEYRAGLHFGGGGLVAVELIDPESGAVKPMAEGETGELVYTALKREACPLLRLRSHDYVRVYPGRCACGRTSLRFDAIGRSDDMFTVKGVNVFPTSIQSALVKLRPRVTGEFQVVLDRAPPIEYPPVLLVEAAHDLPESRQADLRAEIAASIRRELGFSATVELVRQGTIASEHKTRRVHRIYDGAPDPRTGTPQQKEGWKR